MDDASALLDWYRIDRRDNQSAHRRRLARKWQRHDKIGEGAFGTVYLEKDESTGQLRAVKEVRKTCFFDHRRELIALTRLARPAYEDFFGQFLGWREDLSKIWIYMEYFEHGDLSKYIDKPFREKDCKDIVFQLLSGLAVMHADMITHRDLKPKNIFVLQQKPRWRVKIGDFGVSKRVCEDETGMGTLVGSKYYMSPEVAGYVKAEEKNNAYNSRVDVWSVGVVAYKLLTSTVPFYPINQLVDYCYGMLDFPTAELHHNSVSDQGIVFLRSLLQTQSSLRPNAEDALDNSWFERGEQSESELQYNRASSPGVEFSRSLLQPHSSLIPNAEDVLDNSRFEKGVQSEPDIPSTEAFKSKNVPPEPQDSDGTLVVTKKVGSIKTQDQCSTSSQPKTRLSNIEVKDNIPSSLLSSEVAGVQQTHSLHLLAETERHTVTLRNRPEYPQKLDCHLKFIFGGSRVGPLFLIANAPIPLESESRDVQDFLYVKDFARPLTQRLEPVDNSPKLFDCLSNTIVAGGVFEHVRVLVSRLRASGGWPSETSPTSQDWLEWYRKGPKAKALEELVVTGSFNHADYSLEVDISENLCTIHGELADVAWLLLMYLSRIHIDPNDRLARQSFENHLDLDLDPDEALFKRLPISLRDLLLFLFNFIRGLGYTWFKGWRACKDDLFDALDRSSALTDFGGKAGLEDLFAFYCRRLQSSDQVMLSKAGIYCGIGIPTPPVKRGPPESTSNVRPKQQLASKSRTYSQETVPATVKEFKLEQDSFKRVSKPERWCIAIDPLNQERADTWSVLLKADCRYSIKLLIRNEGTETWLPYANDRRRALLGVSSMWDMNTQKRIESNATARMSNPWMVQSGETVDAVLSLRAPKNPGKFCLNLTAYAYDPMRRAATQMNRVLELAITVKPAGPDGLFKAMARRAYPKPTPSSLGFQTSIN